MSDRDLIARACCGAAGAEWSDRATRERCYLYTDAVLAALGATGDDVLVALPGAQVVEWAGSGNLTLATACRAALARGCREPVTVTLDPDDAAKVAARLRSEAGGGWDFSHRVADALDAALGGES